MMRWTLACSCVFAILSIRVLVGQVRPNDPEWTAPAKHAEQVNPLSATEQIVGGGVSGRTDVSYSVAGKPLGLFYGFVHGGVDPATGTV